MRVGLWVAQVVLAVTFVGSAIWKVATPIATLATMIPWAGQMPALLYVTAFFDLLGGIGIILPSITKIQPWLVRPAAIGCALLQVCAIVFHLSRGEGKNTPLNFVLVGLAVFIFLKSDAGHAAGVAPK